MELPPTHCLVSKTHKSWGAAGSPQLQWSPWLQQIWHGRSTPGGILQFCLSSLGDLLERDAPPSPHILELPSILWVLSCHAAKTGQAVDKPPRASGTQGPCLQFCKICGPQPVLPQWGLQNQALGPSTLPSRQAARQETPGLSRWLCCVCSHGWTEYGEWLCLLTIPPPPPP